MMHVTNRCEVLSEEDDAQNEEEKETETNRERNQSDINA